MKARFLICAVLLLTTACSDRWRTSDPEMSQADALALLQEAQGSASAAGGASAEVSSTDPGTQVFFADAPGPMGSVASVLAFDDLSWMGSGAPDIGTVTQARVFFLHSTTTGNDELIIGIGTSGATDFQYFKFYNDVSTSGFDGDEYQSDFSSNGFTLISEDGDGGSLNSTIQLRAYAADSDGTLGRFGQFSVLAQIQ